MSKPSVETANASSVIVSSDGSPESGDAGEASDVEGVGEVIDGEPANDASDVADHRVIRAASFRGPLPPPDVLEGYDRVLPGLAREIADQWKAETKHRHTTIDGLRQTDKEAMHAFYKGERRGQYFALVIFAGIIGVAVTSSALKTEAVSVAAIVSAGASAVWSMRRRSETSTPPTDLAKGDDLESTDQPDH
jgi:uncharacterized membrane protein